MFKLIAFFAILAAAFAAPKPAPQTLTYTSGLPLAYTHIGSPVQYSNIDYNYVPSYAAGYASGYYGVPLAYRNIY